MIYWFQAFAFSNATCSATSRSLADGEEPSDDEQSESGDEDIEEDDEEEDSDEEVSEDEEEDSEDGEGPKKKKAKKASRLTQEMAMVGAVYKLNPVYT